MREHIHTGMNRTGVQMSPFDSAALTKDIEDMMPVGAAGDESQIARVRTAYISDADKLGSMPPPGTMKGMVSTSAAAITGKEPQLLLDKLGERLAFERTGTRLYDALIDKVQAIEQAGVATLPLDKLNEIRAQEAWHFAMVADAIRQLGGDATVQTPCADLAGVESQGLLQAVTDPRTSVTQALHAVLIAELADNNGWEMLIALAREQGEEAMAIDFELALMHERDHLLHAQRWQEEAILGGALPGKA